MHAHTHIPDVNSNMLPVHPQRPQTASSVKQGAPHSDMGAGGGGGGVRHATSGDSRVGEELMRLLKERALVNGGWSGGGGRSKGHTVAGAGRAGGMGGGLQEELCVTGVKEIKGLGASLGGSNFAVSLVVPAAASTQHTSAHM